MSLISAESVFRDYACVPGKDYGPGRPKKMKKCPAAGTGAKIEFPGPRGVICLKFATESRSLALFDRNHRIARIWRISCGHSCY